MEISMSARNYSLALALALANVGCHESADQNCAVGSAGCPCAAGTCAAGLVCNGEVCVFPGGESGSAETSSMQTTSADTGVDTGGSADTGSSVEGGPVIQELFTVEASLSEDGILTFTAQVTDPDGLADIVGGVLVDDESGANYGAFVQISEGSFSAAVSWAQVDDVRAIEFEGTGSRTYRAEFTDTTQKTGTRTVEIPFECGVANAAVCGDGQCRPLGTPSDCQSCNTPCPYHDCDGGVCPDGEWTSCFAIDSSFVDISCDDICPEQGYDQCVLGCMHENFEGVVGSFNFIWYMTLAECEADGPPPIASDYCSDSLYSGGIAYGSCCCGPV